MTIPGEAKLSDEEKKKLADRHQDELQKATMRLAQAGMNRAMGDFGKMFGGGLPALPQMKAGQVEMPVLPQSQTAK
jgi:hypothetical protein